MREPPEDGGVWTAERTVDALWDRIGAALKEFSPQECADFFAAAGYEPD